jgi:hypothetical protein
MTDASAGAPLDGTVTATCTASTTIPVPHEYQAVYTDPAAGDFHRVLQPGTYTLTCKAAGYDDLVIPGVVVVADATTTVNCAMTGPCANNPTAVAVSPPGPVTLCPGTGQVLTCGATGGTGVAYSWYDNGGLIGGATASTYTANATGTHQYACKGTGSGCAGGVLDATPSQVAWQAEPAFAGLSSVTNAQQFTCQLDLAWSAATTPCPGGATYNIYRSTSAGFTPGPGNRIATGVTGTSYQDASGLTNLTTYYYKTRAVTAANGTEEINTVERSGAPTGSGSSSTTLFSESFDGTTFPPTGWTVADVSGTSGNWTRGTASVHPTGIGPNSGAGMAIFNSWTASSGTSTRLARTATMNIPAGVTTASAVLWVYHETGYTSLDKIVVQTSPDGATWSDRGTVNRYDGTTGWKQHAVDLSALIGAGDFRIGYLGVSAYGNDTHLDDVSATATTLVACATGATGPPPVNATGANAARFTKGGGNTLIVAYDAGTCSAQKVIVLHGGLDDFTGYAGCAQSNGGNGGSATLDSTGHTATWYNILWTSGTTAGHPGFATGGARDWSVGTLCGMTADDKTHTTCP